MLFQTVKKIDYANPLIGGYQLVTLGILGFCLYFYGDYASIGSVQPTPVKAVGAASADIDPSISTALAGKSIQEKEKFYKVYKGMADYCSNVSKVRDNFQIRDMMVEVYINYGLEGEPSQSFKTVIDKAYVDSGLKENSAFAPNRAKAGDIFNKIADSVKASIEVDLNKSK